MTDTKKIFETAEERQKALDQLIDRLTADIVERLELMISSDPILSKEVEVDRELRHGRLDRIGIQFKEGRTNDDDIRVWRSVCAAQWKQTYTGYRRYGNHKLVVSMSGYHSNKISHATYQIRKDKTINLEGIVDRMRDMVWQTIQIRDSYREARRIEKKNLAKIKEMYPDFTFNGNPVIFNKDREFEVGETYGNNLNVRASSDGELSMTLKLRGVSENLVKDMIAVLEEHIKQDEE